MALTGVLRPGHVALRVLEMGPALKHYKDVLGLIETARDDKGRVFLKAWDEHDHHSVVLRETDPPTSNNPVCAPIWAGFRLANTRPRVSVSASRSRPAT